MTSKIDQMDLKKGMKDVLKNVGRNLGKIQDIKNSDSNFDESKSSFAGIVWEKGENSANNPKSESYEILKTSPSDTKKDDNAKSKEVIEIKISALDRTTVFSNKLSMWIY